MLFVERQPGAALAPFVQTLWLAQDPLAAKNAQRQRVLPNGRMQLILNLAGEHLTGVLPDGEMRQASALITGVQTSYQTIATEDIADLMGIILRPGGFWPIFGADAHPFSGLETSLEAWLGREVEDLRSRLREAGNDERFELLEGWLTRRCMEGGRRRCELTTFALAGLRQGRPVREIARRSGWSERTLCERFRRQVGVTPKVFDRIERFQRVVQRLHHAGAALDTARLAADCGFYDQAHFCHEFRLFSGINATEYAAADRAWANHLTL